MQTIKALTESKSGVSVNVDQINSARYQQLDDFYP